eukprot:TRINITY_DN33747_c0_g1_i2.p1 TRINITY_DN33747_c0_g1~~TRINITY_DN33747_c0_g1_i2.p1  ORF type:complete len:182 (+),score=27.03 TRINITY_DN33747_c0_g1_i2:206-751(+)
MPAQAGSPHATLECSAVGPAAADEWRRHRDLAEACRCPAGHRLQALGATNSGWACDARLTKLGCKSNITDYHQTTGMPVFRCEICDYDLCEPCCRERVTFLERVFARQLPQAVLCPAGHVLKAMGVTNSGWACDARNMAQGCRSKITGHFQTDGMTSFRCDRCDFDLCEPCWDAKVSSVHN